MDVVCFLLWFMVTVASLWDIRRTQLKSQAMLRNMQASIERLEDSSERIAIITADVLRRPPPHP